MRFFTTVPKENTVEKEYDGEGSLLWVEDQNGNVTSYTYDQAGRRIEEEFADGKSKTFAYNLAGYLVAETDQNGSVINNSYDAAGRLTERNITRAPGVAGTTEQSFSYDAAGRMTSSTDNNDPADPGSAVETAKSYDALGRVTEETTAGYMVESAYQGTRRTEVEYPGGTVVTMSHDATGNMTSVHRGQQLASSFVYDVNNLVAEQTFGNNVVLTNERDSLYRITQREYHKNQTLIAGYSYEYDGMGNKLYQEDLRRAQDSELYDYDLLYRLTSWERGELNAEKDEIINPVADQTWNLDPVGNWDEISYGAVTEVRQHNDVNELIHRDNEITTGLIYDDNGNLVEDHEHEYTYDVFNRLVEVTCKTQNDVIATYRYDTENRRVKRIVENSGNLNGTTQYVYDGWQVVEERDGQGQLEREYTYGNYIDEPITLTAGGNTYYYHTNNMYNARALTDENGAVVERYRYSAYGSVTILDQNDQEIPASTVGNVYMFQGRRYDAETGLYYYRNRMMSSELGRFLQRDPLGYVDGYSLYMYVRNNPTNYTDPSGKACWIRFNCELQREEAHGPCECTKTCHYVCREISREDRGTLPPDCDEIEKGITEHQVAVYDSFWCRMTGIWFFEPECEQSYDHLVRFSWMKNPLDIFREGLNLEDCNLADCVAEARRAYDEGVFICGLNPPGVAAGCIALEEARYQTRLAYCRAVCR